MSRSSLWISAPIVVFALAGLAGAGLFLAGIHARPPVAIPAPAQPAFAVGSAAGHGIDIPTRTASITQIDSRHEDTTVLFHLDVDPAVLVLDFSSLGQQAAMLNRVAALIEKADMPRDHVVSEAELDAHIRAAGGTPDAYYYGHDYRAADLARFFGLVAREHMPLNRDETWLRDRLDQEGWFKAGAAGALISLPGTGGEIDQSSRTAIFRHELSHAVYFTDPAYVALTQTFWNSMLTEPERAAIRTFLGADGYDTADEDLMANEAQAYLIHTRDPRYFLPAMVGIGPSREAFLRAAFVDAIPEPWLRQSALAVAPVAPPPAPPVTGPQAVSVAPSLAPARPPPHVPRAGEERPEPLPAHP
jgi:hypothetical protein